MVTPLPTTTTPHFQHLHLVLPLFAPHPSSAYSSCLTACWSFVSHCTRHSHSLPQFQASSSHSTPPLAQLTLPTNIHPHLYPPTPLPPPTPPTPPTTTLTPPTATTQTQTPPPNASVRLSVAALLTRLNHNSALKLMLTKCASPTSG
ncbi:unnamed protein product [Taenia asiatica]|uniref:Uncharacterized protein n=1 Tax=Taenia asiatica TaxID=60517 RepID=A0A0R3W091_TAEAS|nr:unnamed protein product [Taenia asiatica]